MSQEFEGQRPTLLTVQIIAGALMQSVVIFTGVFVFLRDGEVKEAPLILGVSFNVFFGAIIASVYISKLFAKKRDMRLDAYKEYLHDEKIDDRYDEQKKEQVLPIFVIKTIVSSALMEGPAILAAVFFFVSGEWWLISIPVLALLVMAYTFPTQEKFNRWANIDGRDFSDRNDENSRDF